MFLKVRLHTGPRLRKKPARKKTAARKPFAPRIWSGYFFLGIYLRSRSTDYGKEGQIVAYTVGSISSRCSGNEPALRNVDRTRKSGGNRAYLYWAWSVLFKNTVQPYQLGLDPELFDPEPSMLFTETTCFPFRRTES